MKEVNPPTRRNASMKAGNITWGMVTRDTYLWFPGGPVSVILLISEAEFFAVFMIDG